MTEADMEFGASELSTGSVLLLSVAEEGSWPTDEEASSVGGVAEAALVFVVSTDSWGCLLWSSFTLLSSGFSSSKDLP